MAWASFGSSLLRCALRGRGLAGKLALAREGGGGGGYCARSEGVEGGVARARRQITRAPRGIAAGSAEERGRGPNASPAEEGTTIAWGATERSSSTVVHSASERE